MRMSGSVR